MRIKVWCSLWNDIAIWTSLGLCLLMALVRWEIPYFCGLYDLHPNSIVIIIVLSWLTTLCLVIWNIVKIVLNDYTLMKFFCRILICGLLIIANSELPSLPLGNRYLEGYCDNLRSKDTNQLLIWVLTLNEQHRNDIADVARRKIFETDIPKEVAQLWKCEPQYWYYYNFPSKSICIDIYLPGRYITVGNFKLTFGNEVVPGVYVTSRY